MDTIDLQLNFLEGNSIELEDNLNIHKVSFSTINRSKIGYLTYNKIIKMLCLQKEDIQKIVTNNDLDVYEFLVLYTYQSIEEKNINRNKTLLNNEKYFVDELISVLQILFNNTVSLDENTGIFYIGKNISSLNKNNFYQFQSIIKKRNCLENIDEDIDNPDSERTRQLLERRKQLRSKVEKTKQSEDNEEDGLTLLDLISIYSEAEHMNLEDVFKYDIYQFNNQFNRMKIFKDYQVNIQALLAGAKNEDINLKHWLSKIDKK